MCRYVIVPQIYADCEELQPHVIKVKHVLQCQAASLSSRQSDLSVYKRICENPVHIGRDVEGGEDIEKEAGLCLTCLGAEAVTEASDSEAPVYTVVHAYRGIRLEENDIEQARPAIRPFAIDIDLIKAEFGNRLAEQKAMKLAKPEQRLQNIYGPVLEQQTAASSRDSAGLLTNNRLAGSSWYSLRKKALSTTSSSNIASTVFSRQSHQSAGTDGTSVSDNFTKPLIRTIGSLDLESVPEKREPSISLTTGYENLSASAIREHMENSWIEAEVDGEVFYVNYFYQRKTQWEKPRNGFIKVLPRTEHLQRESKWQLGRERKRYGGDGTNRGEDLDREPEIIGYAKLYQEVHRGFKEIIGRVSEPTSDDHKTVEPLSSFKPWIESLWTRLKIWAQEVGVEEDAFDSLEYSKADCVLHETLTAYLTNVYEGLRIIEEIICEGLHNLGLVEKHSAMHKFILKTTRESITSNLEDIDALLDKLFLLVDPVKIFLALKNKSGLYASVVEAVKKIELDSEDIADKHDETMLHPTSDENSLAQPNENEARMLQEIFGTDSDILEKGY